MDPAPLIVVAVLTASSTVIGLLWRATTGRVRRRSGAERIDGLPLGDRATLVQFSSRVCAPCVATSRVLGAAASAHAGIRHLELDVEEHHDLVERFRVLQTPTTLILDASGTVRSRIGGAPRRLDVERELERLTAA